MNLTTDSKWLARFVALYKYCILYKLKKSGLGVHMYYVCISQYTRKAYVLNDTHVVHVYHCYYAVYLRRTFMLFPLQLASLNSKLYWIMSTIFAQQFFQIIIYHLQSQRAEGNTLWPGNRACKQSLSKLSTTYSINMLYPKYCDLSPLVRLQQPIGLKLLRL